MKKKQEKESRWLEATIEEEKLIVLAQEVNSKKIEQECEIMFMSLVGEPH